MRLTDLLKFTLVIASMAVAREVCATETSIDRDLATPEATVMAYCRGGIFDLNLRYFHFPEERANSSKSSALKWNNCKIVSISAWKSIGEVVDGYKTQLGDSTLLLQVEAENDAGKPSTQLISFILHRYPEGWKIVSYFALGAD